MSEDGEKDQEKDEETPSRPVTASARRKKRSAERAASDNGSDAEEPSEEDSEGEETKAAKRPAPKGKSSTATRDRARNKVDKPAGKDRPTPKRDAKTKERASLFARILRFLREVWGELKKVVWPTRKQMVTYTAVVLVFLVFMIVLVYGLDFAFNEVVSLVFGK